MHDNCSKPDFSYERSAAQRSTAQHALSCQPYSTHPKGTYMILCGLFCLAPGFFGAVHQELLTSRTTQLEEMVE